MMPKCMCMVIALLELDARKDFVEKMFNQMREELREQVGTMTGTI